MRFFRNRRAISMLLLIVLIVVVVVVVVAGAIAAYTFLPGNLKTQEFDFEGFTDVNVGDAFQLTITRSNSYGVIVTADEKIFGSIEVTMTGNTLNIGVKPGITFGAHERKAEITMPALQRLVLSGATHGTVAGFSSTNSLTLDASGASSVQLNNVRTGDIEIDLSGASSINAQGSGNNLEAAASGASNINLENFVVNNAFVDLSGASEATVNPTGRLDVTASGASHLQYVGEPTLGTIDTSGESSINRK